VVSADGWTYRFPTPGTWPAEVEFVKVWFTNRMIFMDTNFLALPTLSRPGGRVAVIDTDWGTLAVDHPDRLLTERLSGAPRRFPLNSWSGRRLYSQMRQVGLSDLEVRVESLVATSWDPDTSPGVEGLPPFAMVAQSAEAMGVFDSDEAARWLGALEDEARAGRFFLMLAMVAVVGTVPS